jgi:hypothetical protein
VTVISSLTAKGGPVDQARLAAQRIGARPYRLFLVWSRSRGGEVGAGKEEGPCRYEVTPRPKVTGYAAIARNPTVIGVLSTGTVRVEELPLWLTWANLTGAEHPTAGPMGGPKDGVHFWYEIDVDEGRDPTFPAQRFRRSAEPERDEERAQWILMLERQATQDRDR